MLPVGRVRRWIAANPEFAHVRTSHRSPQANGVIERFFQAIKYEHLYRHELDDGVELGRQAEAFRDIYNTIRPHETLGMATPFSAWRAVSTANHNHTESVSEA